MINGKKNTVLRTIKIEERQAFYKHKKGTRVLALKYRLPGEFFMWLLERNSPLTMSSQRGNVARTRPQKHQNATVFKNNKFDTSNHTKILNTKVHDAVCQRCKDVLEWRIKYKKYKTPAQPKKCVKCLQKTVKDAYHIICKPCACKLELCAKCGKKEEIVISGQKAPEKTDGESASVDEEEEDDDKFDLAGEEDDEEKEEAEEEDDSKCMN